MNDIIQQQIERDIDAKINRAGIRHLEAAIDSHERLLAEACSLLTTTGQIKKASSELRDWWGRYRSAANRECEISPNIFQQ